MGLAHPQVMDSSKYLVILELQEIVLTPDEFEAIKLIDLDKLPQSEAGNKMKISQPTLSRILQSARNKIADSIINGKAIKIN
mgnify:CR=1 FL=1